MEPTATGHETIDHSDLHVHRWRVSQLTRLGIPGPLAEVYADHLDWHQIARLVQHGCPPGSRSASSADTDRSPTLIAVLMMWSAGSPMKLNPCCRQAQPVQQPTAPGKFTADDRTQQ
jgi:hypothetical protein